jgi:hypothetical protein
VGRSVYDHHHSDVPGDRFTRWVHPIHHDQGLFQMSCCDCGLVHGVEFDVIFPGEDEPHAGEPCVRFRVRRLERNTGQVRRRMADRREGVFNRLGQVGRRLGGQIMRAWNDQGAEGDRPGA